MPTSIPRYGIHEPREVTTLSMTTPHSVVPNAEDASVTIGGRSQLHIFFRRFRRDRAAVIGAIFILVLISLAATAPLIAKYVVHHAVSQRFPATTDDIGLPTVGPSRMFWFGVDKVGRDMFIRTLYGAQTSLFVAILSTAISFSIGTAVGLAAGFFGGWVDTLISRLIDTVLSLPLLLIAIGLAATCSIKVTGCLGGLIRPGLWLVVSIISLSTWPFSARIVRGLALSIKELQYIEAARSTGAGSVRIMFREILPNLALPIIVYATLTIPTNMLFEATLSYLGVGVPQSRPSWGRMIADASSGQLYTAAWWVLLFPGMFLVLTTLAFNLFGDGLRDALDSGGGGRQRA